MSLSTKHSESAPRGRRFERIFWVVLDGMGYEHARRAVETGRFPALARIAQEGYLGASAPPSPVCQTPPALLALFSGTEPAQNGIWGYRMPDPYRRDLTISGFAAQPRDCTLIWDELERRGIPYSLMNVVSRNDPVWSRISTSLEFGYDGYRMWSKPGSYRLDGRRGEHSYRGIRFRTVRRGSAVQVLRGSGVRALLEPGQAERVELTRGMHVTAQLLGSSLLVLSPLNSAMIMGSMPEGGGESGGTARFSEREKFLDSSAFRAVRRLNEGRDPGELVPLETEMTLSSLSMRQKADLMAAAAGSTRSRLVAGYFPLIDEFNHAYMDMLDSLWPGGRVSEVFLACVSLVDELLARLMASAGPDALLVVSSDHGAMPHRSMMATGWIFSRK